MSGDFLFVMRVEFCSLELTLLLIFQPQSAVSSSSMLSASPGFVRPSRGVTSTSNTFP